MTKAAVARTAEGYHSGHIMAAWHRWLARTGQPAPDTTTTQRLAGEVRGLIEAGYSAEAIIVGLARWARIRVDLPHRGPRDLSLDAWREVTLASPEARRWIEAEASRLRAARFEQPGTEFREFRAGSR